MSEPVLTKTLICLANSRKTSGRCIAGIEVDAQYRPLGWIRPVSDRPGGEVSEHERGYQDGSDVQVLDVVQIPLLEPRGHDYQQENWLLDAAFYWTRVGQYAPRNLHRLVSTPTTLWTPGSSSYNGGNDRVPLATAQGLRDSLRLIQVAALQVAVFAPGAQFDDTKRRVQGRFTYAGSQYRLWITDPKIERQYLAMDNGEYELGPCYLTISLGEPYGGWAYKLIATVIAL